MARVGQATPDFVAEAALPDGSFGTIKLSDYKGKKYVLLVFYPLDFTYVCPSELIAFNTLVDDFASKDVQILSCSGDSKFCHMKWRSLGHNEGGVGPLKYPMLADISHDIAKTFGVLNEESLCLRGLFLIDKKGVLQHALVNNLPIGRSVEEAMRVVDALQFHEKHGEVCPANWKKGKKAMKPTEKGAVEYICGNPTCE